MFAMTLREISALHHRADRNRVPPAKLPATVETCDDLGQGGADAEERAGDELIEEL
jgi:hypothetical protein